MRVPIRVEDDDGVGGGEIDAETSRASGEHENEDVRVGGVELVDAFLTFLVSRGAVEATMIEAGEVEQVERSGAMEHEKGFKSAEAYEKKISAGNKIMDNATEMISLKTPIVRFTRATCRSPPECPKRESFD